MQVSKPINQPRIRFMPADLLKQTATLTSLSEQLMSYRSAFIEAISEAPSVTRESGWKRRVGLLSLWLVVNDGKSRLLF